MENKPIDEKTLRHLAELARIEIEDEYTLLKDLQKILEYFEGLKEIDTEGVEPLLGAAMGKNVFSEDEPLSESETKAEDLRRAFPSAENDFLKTPAVFQE